MVHVQHVAGFHQIAVFVPLHVEQILRLYGGASDFGENRGTSRRAAGILSIHDGIVMILGIQGQVRMRQQRRHAQLGIRGQRAELSRHGRGPPALLIELPAEFLGDFVTQRVGNDDRVLLMRIRHRLHIARIEIGLGGYARNRPTVHLADLPLPCDAKLGLVPGVLPFQTVRDVPVPRWGTDFPRRDEAPVTAVNLVERIGISLESALRRSDGFHDGLALPQHGTQRARGRDDVVIIGEPGEPEAVSAGGDDALHVFIGHVRIVQCLIEQFHDLLVDFTEYVVLFQFGQAHGGDGVIQRQIREHLTRQPLYHRSGFRVIAPGIEVTADVRVIINAILGIAEPVPGETEQPDHEILHRGLVQLIAGVKSVDAACARPVVVGQSHGLDCLDAASGVFGVLREQLPPDGLQAMFADWQSQQRCDHLRLEGLGIVFRTQSLLQGLNQIVIIKERLTPLHDGEPITARFGGCLTREQLVEDHRQLVRSEPRTIGDFEIQQPIVLIGRQFAFHIY